MTSDSINRRRLLQGAGVAGATVLSTTVLASSASAKGRKGDDHDHGHDDVEGAWVVDHRDDKDPEDKGVGVLGFAEGGVVTLQEINPVSPSSVGAWREHRGHFHATLWSGIRGEGPADAGFTFKLELKGEIDDDQMEGTYKFTGFDAATGAEAFSGTGTFDGERIEA